MHHTLRNSTTIYGVNIYRVNEQVILLQYLLFHSLKKKKKNYSFIFFSFVKAIH